MIGDVNGDDTEDLVLGGVYADNNGTNTGSAWVFFSTLIDDETGTGNNKYLATGTNYNIRYDGANTDSTPYLTFDGAIVTGDINGDGKGDLMLGAPNSDVPGTDAGSLYVMFSTLIDEVTTTGVNKPLNVASNYNV